MSQIANRIRPSTATPGIPPLQNGDRLNRIEFERRYDAMPNLKKAELIDGRVYMASPVSHSGHSVPHSDLMGVFSLYRAQTPGVVSGDNGSLRLDLENMPQPDAYLLIASSHGGQSKIDTDDYVAGAPELVAEIAASSSSYDLHEKMNVYHRAGVREYIVWRTLDGQFDYFVLRQGEFQRLEPSTDGVFRSEVFTGLWIDAPALLKNDLARALKTLQDGIASPEHQSFTAALQNRAAKKQF
jgi:Uma2 family endonuclease